MKSIVDIMKKSDKYNYKAGDLKKVEPTDNEKVEILKKKLGKK